MNRRELQRIMLCVMCTLAVGCSVTGPPPDSGYSYQRPSEVGDGWQTVDAGSVGLDVTMLSAMADRLSGGEYKNIHSVLVVRGGRIAFEEYYPGTTTASGTHVDWTINDLHEVHSVTKSVTSALVGIAIDRGLISSIDQKISDFFPEHAALFADGSKASLTVRHFLTMTAGLEWDERTHSYFDPRNSHVQLHNSDDPVAFTLGLTAVAEPGQTFRYNSGLSIVLGEVIRRVSGMRADDFAKQHLFDAIGVEDYWWWAYPNGTLQTGGGLALTPRDMARFGLLYLDEGSWRGAQILSTEWVRESTRSHLDTISDTEKYGYQWWIIRLPRHDNAFDLSEESIVTPVANGRGGQWIFLLPELDMVVVFTGGNDNELAQQPLDILRRFIYPAALETYNTRYESS